MLNRHTVKFSFIKKILEILFALFVTFVFSENISSLPEAAEKIGARLYWDPLSTTGILEKNGHQLSFSAGSGIVLYDYNKLAVIDEPENRNGTIYVTEAFLKQARAFFETDISSDTYYKIGAILIDAGHGGKDPGAVYTHTIDGQKVLLQEKDITLTVAKMLDEKLKKAYPDKKIMMTREQDVFLSLEQRVEKANNLQLGEHEAILYVAIHVNAAFDKKAKGFEVWYLSPGYRRTVIQDSAAEDKEILPILNSMMEEEYTTESILIAKFILDGLTSQVGTLTTARGIKEEEWFVVRNANMPSVLVELGFLTNYEEAVLLNDKSYLLKTAAGIYNGLSAFVTHFENSRGFTTIQ